MRQVLIGVIVVLVLIVVAATTLPLSMFGGIAGPSTSSNSSKPEGLVLESTYGDDWPFLVSSGIIRCERDYGTAVVLVVGSTKYALNGRARGQIDSTGWRDSREIIRKNEAGGLFDVSMFIRRGTQMCDGDR